MAERSVSIAQRFKARWQTREDAGGQESHSVAEEVSAEDLREFVEADKWGSGADPVFREELRAKLWDLVTELYEPAPAEASSQSKTKP